MSSSELNLLGQTSARTSAYLYWLISPYSFIEQQALNRDVYAYGGWLSNYLGISRSVRPAVSLVAGMEYEKGDGSTTNPYIVDLSSLNN